MDEALPRFVVWVLKSLKREAVRKESVLKENAVFLERRVRFGVGHGCKNMYELFG